MKSIGQVIRERRLELGYTVTQLAKQLGVTSQAVSNWERVPDREPSKEHLPRLADLLGIRVQELLGTPEIRLSVEETQLLNAFRELSKSERLFVIRMLVSAVDRSAV